VDEGWRWFVSGVAEERAGSRRYSVAGSKHVRPPDRSDGDVAGQRGSSGATEVFSASQRSASIAARQPVPAAVTA
jgi:hypothetical protein